MVKEDVREKIVASFKQLASKHTIEKITIKEITELAQISRPTFYNHFKDKYEVLEYIIHSEIFIPVKALVDNNMIRECVELIFTLIHREKEFYMKAVMLEGQNSFESIARAEASYIFLRMISNLKIGNQGKYEWLSKETIAEYYAQAMVYIAISWIKRDMVIPPKELSEIYMYITDHSLIDIIKDFE